MANFETYEVKVYDNGDKIWYQNGKYHRIDGPAVERANGDKFWFQNGKYHRIDGPAVESANGDKFWYIDGVYYSEQRYNAEITKRNANTCEDRLVEIDGIKYKLTKI